ncbi:MAG: ABC transporter permease [Planctomycetota bacterium]|jgi:tungstate transport system permease protein
MTADPSVWELFISGDPAIWNPLVVSVKCAAGAALLAVPVGVPVGLMLGLGRGRWSRVLRAVADAGLAIPTTVVALMVYLLLYRQGPLGGAGLLFSPTAIILGQALVAVPVVVLLVAEATAALDPRVRWTAMTLGAGPVRRTLWYAGEIRGHLLASALSAFGRAAGELGVALILGGNILGKTRTLSTAITVDLSRGLYERAVALGVLLLLLALGVIVLVRLVAPRRAGG